MEEDAKPRKFADRIALQQARQAEIDSVLEQQMRELDIVTPSNPRRFMDKIALQKQRQDDLQKILASVSPSAATLGSEFQPPHPSSTSSGEGVGGPQQLHQTRSAGPLQDHYGPAPASPYWPEPQHPHSGVGGGGYAHHPHGGERPLEKPASFPTVPPGYHSGGGYQSMPPAQAANSPYGYYGSQQAPNVPQVRSQPVVPTSPMMINNGQEDFPDRAAYRGRMSPYASPQLYQGGPHIVAPDSGNFRYSSSPGNAEPYSPEPPRSASSFTIDSLLAPTSGPTGGQSLNARRERGGSVRIKRQGAAEDPFANRRATSMRMKKPGQHPGRNRSLDGATAVDFAAAQAAYGSSPHSPGFQYAQPEYPGTPGTAGGAQHQPQPTAFSFYPQPPAGANSPPGPAAGHPGGFEH